MPPLCREGINLVLGPCLCVPKGVTGALGRNWGLRLGIGGTAVLKEGSGIQRWGSGCWQALRAFLETENETSSLDPAESKPDRGSVALWIAQEGHALLSSPEGPCW